MGPNLRLILCLLLGIGASLVVIPLASAEEAEPAVASKGEALLKWVTRRQRAIIRDYFGGRRGGVFVDVGAAHYSEGSMTFFLEDELGWSGIAVDALEHWGMEYPKHRPRTTFWNFIVTDHVGAKEPFYRLKQGGDIGSTAIESRAKTFGDALGLKATEILVPTITLDKLLEDNSIEKIDFLSMDIEGGEPAALAGFDIRRFRPELVGIEVFPENADTILDYFRNHGYRRIEKYYKRYKRDWFFTCEVDADCKADTTAPKAPGAASETP